MTSIDLVSYLPARLFISERVTEEGSEGSSYLWTALQRLPMHWGETTDRVKMGRRSANQPVIDKNIHNSNDLLSFVKNASLTQNLD